MPSDKVLLKKQEVVTQLKETLQGAVAGVLVDYRGINVAADTKLRREMREAGIEYTVVKNTLLKLAATEAGYEGLNAVLEGTTALAISKTDHVAAAKILSKYAEDSKGKFTIKAGFLDDEVINADKVIAVGKLPSREQLIGQLLSVLNGNIRGLAVALNAIAEKNGGTAEDIDAVEATEVIDAVEATEVIEAVEAIDAVEA